MSYKLGMIVSDECSEETLNVVKERFEENKKTFEGPYPDDYCLYLKKVDNAFIDNQILPGEIHLEVSQYHDTRCSPISLWESYDTDTIIKKRKTPSKREDLESFLIKIKEKKIKTLVDVNGVDVDGIISRSQKRARDFEVTPSFISEHNKMRKCLEKGSKIWIDIIKFMRIERKIKKVGLFSYRINAPIKEMKFEKMERIECSLEELTLEYLLRVKMNTLVFFV